MTETSLATALNVSYMATQLSLFSLVVGVALLLARAWASSFLLPAARWRAATSRRKDSLLGERPLA